MYIVFTQTFQITDYIYFRSGSKEYLAVKADLIHPAGLIIMGILPKIMKKKHYYNDNIR